ncbi:putative N2,N2-dimethylguanosine tRNA methyltransferase [Aspergillus clavatus NRRL 1]|uniref:tRNA (guanine(26)-N(2))-dimethyltransferase n=1 Tax=Aspergillus clavatus (strain ATCC 1007 / CBS 513.65 / DSM 816 / NCTC 3887 / NRRL 1 / QM 1276 / 107) TaxID=344612 RepID=A1CC48_ASPCL|nr:N2,N2-dimethylguanosine tRNA methyltransferase, putative [Aspergillus clavatus NRRL 1]EAW12105.1 N2,N2-dimethylguanosine tRNA methyltransferase, putative [Aspergillus clavatus NRRL 1]
MQAPEDLPVLKADDVDSRSLISMQELDPSPVHEEGCDLESGDYFSRGQDVPPTQGGLSNINLGLRGHNWDSWLSALQKYSTYPPTLFFALHFANTSLIPLITRSVPDSENYLLLTRPLYQSPSLEHAVLTLPILAHVASGIVLRNIRSSRRARLYGVETRSQRYTLAFWPRMSLQARLGYLLIPLLGAHVLVNRVVPLVVDGGSSGVGLGYVAHGFARSPGFWNIYYLVFVTAGVWHFVGGWANWMGWRVTTARKERGHKKGSLEGYLGHRDSEQRAKRQRKIWWVVNGIAARLAIIWLSPGSRRPGFLVHPLPTNAYTVPHRRLDTLLSRYHISTMAEKPIQADVPDCLVQHDGKEYKAVREGRASILNPPAQAAASKGTKKDLRPEDESQSVFYNPIQQFNRDLSVLAIKAYGEHLLALKKLKAEKKRSGVGRGKKRKRDDEAGTEQPATSEELPGANGNSTASAPHPEQSVIPFTILDALSATGLRALRYASEIPFVTCVVANDLSSSAIQSMKTNIEYNDLGKLIRPNLGDARAYMYSILNQTSTPGSGTHTSKFDVIDLDPYGTAASFMDAAVQAVKDGGLLCVTCTDAGVWASNGYPEKAYALYGGVPIKGSHSHEGGLRLILHALATSAAKYGLAIEPLLSLSIDFYARVFVRVHRSPAEVKFTSGNTMVVYNCDSGCGAWSTQPLTQTKQRLDKKGNPFYHYGFAQGPIANAHCEHCGFKTHVGGPMWAGPLHNPHFIQKILDMLPSADREIYQTVDRIEGMLTTALEEDLFLDSRPGAAVEGTSDDDDGKASGDATSPAYSAIIPRSDPAARDPFPFYFTLSSLAKVLHTSTISVDAFRGALRHLGYRSTRSHTKPNTIRTDAPWEVIWEVMREWARQKAPIKEGALRPGTPGAAIMAKSRENLHGHKGDDRLDILKREIASATENSQDVADLVTKIEAALYRAKCRQTAESGPSVSDPLSTEPREPHAPAKEKGQGEAPQTSRVIPAAKQDLSTLEVVFDEALGREASLAQTKKRLVRYQINPRANWGPLNRASG